MKFESQIFKKQAEKDVPEKKRMTDKERQAEWEENNHKKLVSAFSRIFKENSTQQEKIYKFDEGIGKILSMLNENEISQDIVDEIKDSVKTVCCLDDEEEFIEQGIKALKPIIDWQRENRGLFEKKEREFFIQDNNFVPLNEMLSYGQDKNSLHIHVAPSLTLATGEKFALLKDGFRSLQEVLRSDESIKEITATSWIVATESGGGILEKFGFTIVGKNLKDVISSKTQDHENRPVGTAHVSREDFLNQKI